MKIRFHQGTFGVCKTNSVYLWSFEFNSPKDMVVEITGKHFSCSEHISRQAIGIRLRIHLSGQWLMHRLPSPIVFPRMWPLKFPFVNLSEIYIILIFTSCYALLKKRKKKKMPILNLRFYCIYNTAKPSTVDQWSRKENKKISFNYLSTQFFSSFKWFVII